MNNFPDDQPYVNLQKVLIGYTTRYRWVVTGLGFEPLPSGFRIHEVFGEYWPDPRTDNWPIEGGFVDIKRLEDVYEGLTPHEKGLIDYEAWKHHYTFRDTYQAIGGTSEELDPQPVVPDDPDADMTVFWVEQSYTIEDIEGPILQEHLLKMMRGNGKQYKDINP